ncbi:MAG: hypothetical protein IPJ06_19590 [Saprospiraceae bacterium]|nr:hypothetical protein [Saprospiraceae bacterium]
MVQQREAQGRIYPLREGDLIQVWKQLEWGEPAIYSDKGGGLVARPDRVVLA